MDSAYPVPACIATARDRISKSLFIVHIFRAADWQQFSDTLEGIRKEQKGASHNCWAHILGPPEDSTRWGMSDDGEPRGCAGKPMLHVLSHSGIGEIGAVITRFYGGVKLGTGGLTRAYSKLVQYGLHDLKTTLKIPVSHFTLVFPYSLQPAIEQILDHFEVNRLQASYGITVSFDVSVARNLTTAFLEQLQKLRNEELFITPKDDKYDQTVS